MATNASELERLFITLLADDSKLEESYRRIVARARQVGEEVSRAFETGAGKAFVDSGAKVEASAQRQAKALDPVKKALEAVKNETASLRNTVEAGTTTNDVAIQRFNELQTSALAQAAALEVTSKEYRGFTQAAAQASRSIATLEGRATKLGFSANAAVGISAALRQNFGELGKAGDVAARGLGVMQLAFGGFTRTAPGVTGVLDALNRGFRQLNFVLPLIGAAASAAAIVGLVKLGNVAAEVADQIDKGSQAAGLSAEAYQELRFAFQQNGVSAEGFDMAVQSLNRRLGLAAQGNETYAKTYRQLGIEIRDAQGAVRDTDSILTDAIDAISRLPSAAEQAAAASVIFGDDVGKKLVPVLRDGVQGINDLRDAAREMGLVVSGDAVLSLVEYKDAMAVVTGQFKTTKTEIVAAFIPLLTTTLIPILQNTLVPAIQNTIDKVQDFSDKITDTGPVGEDFRAQMAANLAPLVAFGQTAVGVGASVLGAFQAIIAGAAQLGTYLGTLSAEIEQDPRGTFQDFARGVMSTVLPFAYAPPEPDSTAFDRAAQAGEEAAQAYYEAALNSFATAGEAFQFDLAALLADLTRSTNEALAAGANNLFSGGENDGPPGAGEKTFLAGSLAALKKELQTARSAYEEAGTDAGRSFQLAIITELEQTIVEIERRIAAADPFAGARAWTNRLGLELEFGLKPAAAVFDIINPRAQELREEIAGLIQSGDFESPELQVLITKLEILEALLGRVTKLDPTLTIDVDTTRALAKIEASLALVESRYGDGVAATIAAVERTEGVFTSVSGAIRAFGRLGITVTAPMLDALTARFGETANSADRMREAIRSLNLAEAERNRAAATARFDGDGAIALTISSLERTEGAFNSVSDAVRAFGRAGVTLTGPVLDFLIDRFGDAASSADRLVEALKRIQLAESERARAALTTRFDDGVLATISAVQRSEGVFTSVSDAIRAFGRVGITVTGPVLEYLTERFSEAADAATLYGIALATARNQRAADLQTDRFGGDNAALFAISGVERTEGQITSLSDAFRRFARADVPVTAEVLRALEARFADNISATEAFEARLAAAGVAAATLRSQLAGEILDVRFGDGIEATISGVQRVAGAFTSVSDGVRKLSDAGVTLTAGLLEALEAKFAPTDEEVAAVEAYTAALAELAVLTGDAPTEFDNLAAAFRAAAEAGVITDDALRDLLETLGLLEQAAAATQALEDLASDIDIGSAIVNGLDDAIQALRDGDLQASIGGLTSLGVAIGTAIGGPAVGALVGSIGGAIQAVVSLGQTLSDLFTGDSQVRRDLEQALAGGVANAFRTGILDGLKGGDDWQASLREGVRDAIFGAIVDAFVQAAIIESIFAPFLDEFTRLLNRAGPDGAFDFFDANFGGILDNALDVAEEFVRRGQRLFPGTGTTPGSDVVDPTGTIELPNATVTVLAAPQWARDLTTAAITIGQAGAAMLDAANLMQATFREGVTVKNTSGRGVDAARAA